VETKSAKTQGQRLNGMVSTLELQFNALLLTHQLPVCFRLCLYILHCRTLKPQSLITLHYYLPPIFPSSHQPKIHCVFRRPNIRTHQHPTHYANSQFLTPKHQHPESQSSPISFMRHQPAELLASEYKKPLQHLDPLGPLADSSQSHSA
jgi:hypothetical protein